MFEEKKSSGGIGGITLNNIIEGKGIAIYIKPDGTTGYLLLDSITGQFYPNIGMFEAGGNITATQMGTTTVLPSQLYDDSPYVDYGKFSETITGDINGGISGDSLSIIDQPWGIWHAGSGGTYTATPSANWSASINADTLVGGVPVSINRIEVSGTEWSNNRLIGSTRGYWGDVYKTGILVGETLGTFDPTAYTWQALS
ncbi:MAG: hypothetical protein AB1348_03250, partial [Nitrospirota bacterium]